MLQVQTKLKVSCIMSINVMLEFQCRADKIEAFKSVLEVALVDTRNYDGCVSVQVTVNHEAPLNLIFLEVWESREHNEKYLAWRTDTGLFETLSDMLSSPPTIRYFENLNI